MPLHVYTEQNRLDIIIAETVQIYYSTSIRLNWVFWKKICLWNVLWDTIFISLILGLFLIQITFDGKTIIQLCMHDINNLNSSFRDWMYLWTKTNVSIKIEHLTLNKLFIKWDAEKSFNYQSFPTKCNLLGTCSYLKPIIQ